MKSIAAVIFLFAIACLQLQAQMSTGDEGEPTPESFESKSPKPRVLYGTASYYADKFIGRKTATGAIYSHHKMTAACNKLPLGTWIRVTNLRNKRTVVLQVNDRLHPKNPRIVDISRMGAEKLGYIGRGLTQVKVEVLGRKKSN